MHANGNRRSTRSAASSGVPLGLILDSTSSEPLYRQVCTQLRRAILSGALEAGARLPSTRVLAAELNIARNTATLAYDSLQAEGYLTAGRGSGTYVSRQLPRIRRRDHAPRSAQPLRPSRVASALLADTYGPPLDRGAPRPFRLGDPGLDLFPLETWARILARHARMAAGGLLSYGDAAGHPLLRRAVLEYVAAARGVRAEPDQVFLVRGAQQAIDLIARVLLDPGDQVWVEDPGYLLTRSVMLANQVRTVPVPVDRDGLVIDAGARIAPHARAAFVTPSNHFPLSVTMSLNRRLELLSWARRAGAWIVEDDYDSEFRYGGRPLPSLQSLDEIGLVLYVGTFSRTMFPALRLGYVVVPRALVPVFRHVRDRFDAMLPTAEHAAMADFIIEGGFARHVRRMRKAYADRQAALVEEAQNGLAAFVHLPPVEAGMHVIGWLQSPLLEQDAVRAAARHGIEVRPLSLYCAHQHLAPALVFGFAPFPEGELRMAVRRLAHALASSEAWSRRD